jgi:hypothetical protein
MAGHNKAEEIARDLAQKWFSEGDFAERLPHVLLRAVLTMRGQRSRYVQSGLIEKAASGDADADAVLSWEAANCLTTNQQLPPLLASYVADILLQRFISHQRQRGGDPYANALRDIFIVYAVKQLEEKCGLLPTRGRDKHGSQTASPSGCSVVAQVLKNCALTRGISEAAAEDVWKQRDKYGIPKSSG